MCIYSISTSKVSVHCLLSDFPVERVELTLIRELERDSSGADCIEGQTGGSRRHRFVHRFPATYAIMGTRKETDSCSLTYAPVASVIVILRADFWLGAGAVVQLFISANNPLIPVISNIWTILGTMYLVYDNLFLLCHTCHTNTTGTRSQPLWISITWPHMSSHP
jgi:hypothetical protein